MMNKKEYEEEIKLIKKQNPVEIELYPLIAEIIQPTLKSLSKRYVFNRKKSKRAQIFYGLSSFPDIAIISKKFESTPLEEVNIENWKYLKGCIEAKRLNQKLLNIENIHDFLTDKEKKPSKELGQLLGEILWYKKVIYTNGIQWKLFYIDYYSDNLKNKIINTVNSRIKKENSKKEFNWWEEFTEYDWKEITIKSIDITNDCIKDWENFIKNVSNKIKW